MKPLLGGLTVLALLATAVNAQGTCCDIDPSSVPSSTRTTWCRSQLSLCIDLCENGQSEATTNICDGNELTYTCVCASDAITFNISDYRNSLPALECYEWISQCIAASPGDLAAQQSCQSVQCGNRDVPTASSTPVSSSSTSASAFVGFAPSSPTRTSSSTSRSTISSESSSSESVSRSSSSTRTSASSPAASGSGSASNTGLTDAAGSQETGQSDQGGTDGGPPDAGLSTGAKAGIAVGVVLGALAALATLFFCFRRRRGRGQGRSFSYHRSTVQGGAQELETEEKPRELWGSKFHHTTDRELAGNEIHQAPGGFPVGHPHARDAPAETALAPGANGSASHQQQRSDPTSYELPTDPKSPDSVNANGSARFPASQPPTSPSPFAGAGPVPTHLPEDRSTLDDTAPLPLAPANTFVEPSAGARGPERDPGESEAPIKASGDDELARLKAELEHVRQERDRLQMMQSLSAREEELKRAIEVREMG